MDSATYRHLFAQPSEKCAIPHQYFPSHNLLSVDTLLEVSPNLNGDLLHDGPEFLTRFPCYQPFPYVVQNSSVLFCGSRVIDDATELVKNKMKWERKLKTLRVSNVELAIRKIKKLREDKVVNLSKDIKECIKHFQRDPAPNFSGNYNWLYTGGCLGCNEEHDGTTLIVGDFFDNHPGFYLLKLNETLNEIQYKVFMNLKASSPVLQIACKPKQDNLIICARQKNFVTLFSSHNSYPVKVWRKKVKPSKLLTCVDLNADCEEIVITDSSCDLHIYNVEKKGKVCGYSGKKFKSSYNCWSQVAFEECGIYWVFSNSFAVVDQRDFFNSVKKLEYTHTTATSSCEEICSFVSSPKDSNYVYLGTTHSILQLDLRNAKTVQKWTHLMNSPPQFMTTVEMEDQHEVLVLQSKHVDEVSGIVNKYSGQDKVNFLSTSLPCLFKSVKESFELARLHGLCLSPFVSRRVEFAVTGMQCLKRGENDFILFTANSGGDIFQSRIKKKTSEESAAEEDNQDVLNTMRTYEAHWENFPLGNSNKEHLDHVDMREVVKGLRETQSTGRSEEKEREKQKSEIHWPYTEMYGPESLKMYKDVLAQKILRVWGYHSESETDYDEAVETKVREWMEKC